MGNKNICLKLFTFKCDMSGIHLGLKLYQGSNCVFFTVINIIKQSFLHLMNLKNAVLFLCTKIVIMQTYLHTISVERFYK